MLIFCISGTTPQSSSPPRIFTKLDEDLTGKNIDIDESEKELDEMIKTLNISSQVEHIEMMPLPPSPNSTK